MKTILAPVDFSPVTDAVLKEAAMLADARGARIVLLHTTQPPIITSEYAPMMTADFAEITAAGEKAAERNLEKLAQKITATGRKAATLLLTGSPVSNIIEQAKKLKADHIVLGSHGHTAFYELLVGSTTHGVLMKAGCPVVIVPTPAPRKKAAKRK